MFLFLYHITLFIRTKKSRRAWRNSETAKRLADFLVFCSYVNKLESAIFHPQIITDYFNI